MTTLLSAIEKNLTRGVRLLEYISDDAYSNMSVPPYYSSIGGHMRHILDVFDCILEGVNSGQINLIARKRNEMAEMYTAHGLDYFNSIRKRLHELQTEDQDKIVRVTDDLGLGVVEANYTLGGILIQAHSHAIHHFASVGYVIAQLGLQLPDDDFGFNPTTPKITKTT
jgi:uncharacterized damage-inducible protein DinB